MLIEKNLSFVNLNINQSQILLIRVLLVLFGLGFRPISQFNAYWKVIRTAIRYTFHSQQRKICGTEVMIKREIHKPMLGVKSVEKASPNSRIKQSTNLDIFKSVDIQTPGKTSNPA